jgi:hypothetical protein
VFKLEFTCSIDSMMGSLRVRGFQDRASIILTRLSISNSVLT